MISKNTNENEVKLLFSFAVVAIALVGLAILPAFLAGSDAAVEKTKADFEIKDVEDLFTFANNVNQGKESYSGKTVRLIEDIDLAGESWNPIGQSGKFNGVSGYRFAGTFDGAEHTIYNMTVDKWVPEDTLDDDGIEKGCYASGFFGFIDEGSAIIKNVNFVNADVSGHHWVGVVAGHMTGTVENCHVFDSTIKNTHKDINACGNQTGTIIGYANSDKNMPGYVSLINCTAWDCLVIGARDAGQLCGYAHGETILNGCAAINVRVEEVIDNNCNHERNGQGIRNEFVGMPNGCTITGSVQIKESLILSEDVMGDYILYASDVSIEIEEGCTFSGSITFDGNKVVFKNLKAGVGGITIAPGSLTISGVIDASSGVEITASGEVKINGSVMNTDESGSLMIRSEGEGTTVTVVGSLTVGTGAKLTVAEGATLTVADNAFLKITENAEVALNENSKINGGGDVIIGGTLTSTDSSTVGANQFYEGDAMPSNSTSMDTASESVAGGIDASATRSYAVLNSGTVKYSGDPASFNVDVYLVLKDGVTVTVEGKIGNESLLYVYVGTFKEGSSTVLEYKKTDCCVAISQLTGNSVTISATHDANGSKFIVSGDVTAHYLQGRNLIGSGSVAVADGKILRVTGNQVSNGIDCGISIDNKINNSTHVYTFYPNGATASKETIGDQDVIKVTDGSITIQQGDNVLDLKDMVGASVEVKGTNDLPFITIGDSGTGIMTVVMGAFKTTPPVDGTSTGVTINGVRVDLDDGTAAYTSEVVAKVGSENVVGAEIFGKVVQTSDINSGTIVIEVGNGAEFTVNEGVEINIMGISTEGDGIVIAKGGVLAQTISGGEESNIKITPSGYVRASSSFYGVQDIIEGGYAVIGGDLVGTTAGDLILTTDGRIPAGKQYTITGDFGLNGKKLVVEGTLIIDAGANVFGTTLRGEGIELVGKGSIVIDGYLGKNMPIKVSYVYGTTEVVKSTLSIQGVEGIQIAVVENGADAKVLTVSGVVEAIRGAPASTVVFGKDAQISGNLVIGKGVTLVGFSDSTEILDGSDVEIVGTFDGKVSLSGESQIVINGTMSEDAVIGTADSEFTVTGGSLSGLVVETVKKEQTNDTEEEYESWISGDVTVIKDHPVLAITAGEALVGDDMTLCIGKGVGFEAFDGDNSRVAIEGKIVAIRGDGDTAFDDVKMAQWTGAYITVTTGIDEDMVQERYFTTFDQALEMIQSADKKTVTTNNIQVFTEGFALVSGEIVKLSEDVFIDNEAEVVLASGATIDGIITNVKGKLVAEPGAKVKVVACDAEYTEGDNTVYAGLDIAVRDSDGSKPITVVRSEVENLVVGSGKTIEVANQILVTGNLEVQEGASIVGTKTGASLFINGTEKAVIDGNVDVSQVKVLDATLMVNGTLTVDSEVTGVINAAEYEDGGRSVYTNLLDAVATGKDVTIYGKVSDKSTITLKGEQALTVDAEADVELSEIVLKDRSGLIAESAIDSKVDTGISQFEIKGTITVENDGKDTNITALDGSIEIVGGEVVFETLTLSDGTISVGTGATLEVEKDKTVSIQNKAVLNIEGTMVVNGTVNIDGEYQNIPVVSGMLDVNGAASFGYINVLGTLDIAKTATFKAYGLIVGSVEALGANGSVIGKVTGGDEPYFIRAYDGANLSDETVKGLDYTTFFVNGVEFATVYTNGDYVISSSDATATGVFRDDVVAEIPGVIIPEGGIQWKDASGTVVDKAATKIGEKPALYTTISTEVVDIILSIESGIQLEVDYRFYTETRDLSLPAGTYKVAAKDLGATKDTKIVMICDGVETLIENGLFTVDYDMVGKKVILQASYVTEAPAPEYSEDIVVSINYITNTRLVISITALDGKVIPAGTVKVFGNYVHEVVDPIKGTSLKTESYEETFEIAEGKTFVVLDSADEEFIVGMISVTAVYGSADASITEESNAMSFKYVAPVDKALDQE